METIRSNLVMTICTIVMIVGAAGIIYVMMHFVRRPNVQVTLECGK